MSGADKKPSSGKSPRSNEPPSDLATCFPNASAWALGGGWIEIGQDYRGGPYARALDEGGEIWEGKRKYRTLEEALKALDKGIAAWLKENA